MESGIIDDLTFEELENAYVNESRSKIVQISVSKCRFGVKGVTKICDKNCKYYMTCSRRKNI